MVTILTDDVVKDYDFYAVQNERSRKLLDVFSVSVWKDSLLQLPFIEVIYMDKCKVCLEKFLYKELCIIKKSSTSGFNIDSLFTEYISGASSQKKEVILNQWKSLNLEGYIKGQLHILMYVREVLEYEETEQDKKDNFHPVLPICNGIIAFLEAIPDQYITEEGYLAAKILYNYTSLECLDFVRKGLKDFIGYHPNL